MQRPQQMVPNYAGRNQYSTPQRPVGMAQPPQGRMMPHPSQIPHQQQYAQQGHAMPQHRPQQQRQQHAPPPMLRKALDDEAERRKEQMLKNHRERPTDLNLPDGMDKIAIGNDAVHYKQLRDFEKRLDALMTRKDMEYSNRLKQRGRRTKKMRIWISNTAENQPWQGGELDPNSFDFRSDSIATYRVKITGRLHDNDDDLNIDNEEGVNDGEEPVRLQPARKKLSHFFNQITVELDRSKDLQPDGATAIEWKKPAGFQPSDQDLPKTADFDTLEFERKSDENINCTIHLYRDMTFGSGNESDEVCSLSDDLAWIVGSNEATRGEIMEAIYEYVKAEGLQHDDEKRAFQCDERLQKIFGSHTMTFPSLPNLILNQQFKHVSELKPISLPYTIRVDPEYQNNPHPTIYDIIVPAEDLLHERLMAVRQLNPNWVPDLLAIKDLDEQLALVIQRMKTSKARHTFYRGLEKDPVTFLKMWNSSQTHDLKTIIGDSVSETAWYVQSTGNAAGGRDWTVHRNNNLPGDEWRRGGDRGIWGSQGVRESVALMVNKGKNIKAQ